MVKNKHLEDEKNLELLREAQELLSSIKAHYMSFMITTHKEKDNDWKATGKLSIGSSLDGEHWGEVATDAVSYDVNSDSALATVMVSLNNYINSPEFLIEMGNRMKKSLEEESKVPELLK